MKTATLALALATAAGAPAGQLVVGYRAEMAPYPFYAC